MTKNLLLGIAAVCGSTFQAVACNDNKYETVLHLPDSLHH